MGAWTHQHCTYRQGTKDLIRNYTYVIVEALNFLARVPGQQLFKNAKLDLSGASAEAMETLT
jgi:hypothetical protein